MCVHPGRLSLLVPVLLLLAASAGARDAVPIETIAVTDRIHMLVGRGGNVAVVVGEHGVFVVDDQYASQFDEIRAAIAGMTQAPIEYLINTHWHSDHSGGNALMAGAGARIFAHDNVRRRMSTDQVIEFFDSARPASPADALPVITFSDELTFHLYGETVRAFHVDNAHTDGDAVVHFVDANVIHTGDVFFNERYPFIDTGSGGSIEGMIVAAERILDIADDATQIIPGHGPLTDRQGLSAYRDMLRDVQRRVAQLIVSGATEDQAVLAKPTAAYDPAWGGGFLNPDNFVRMVYDNIKRDTLR